MLYLLTLFFSTLEHCRPRGLRPSEDPGHGVLREGDAGAAQGEQGLLRHEDPRQTKGRLKKLL